jgi:polyisoprenoid-binding protein YceI
MSIQQAPGIAATRWRIDPAHSSVEFHVKNFWGIATVRGGFSRYHGTLDLTADPAIELTIEADRLEDGERLTAHGHLHAGGESIALTVEATLRRADDDLQLAAVSQADHRALGMTYNMLGSIAGTSRLIVKGRLERDV